MGKLFAKKNYLHHELFFLLVKVLKFLFLTKMSFSSEKLFCLLASYRETENLYSVKVFCIAETVFYKKKLEILLVETNFCLVEIICSSFFSHSDKWNGWLFPSIGNHFLQKCIAAGKNNHFCVKKHNCSSLEISTFYIYSRET